MNTLQIVDSYKRGEVDEKEARGRLAHAFISSPVARNAVRRYDGTNGRLPMCSQTLRDVEVGLSDLIVDRTLNPDHKSSFSLEGARVNYAGWARNFCATATSWVAKQVAVQNSRHIELSEPDGPIVSRSTRSVLPGSGSSLEGEGSMRVWRALDRWDENALRSRASARLQHSAEALHTLTETERLTRLERRQRRQLEQLITRNNDLPFECMRQVARGSHGGSLGWLLDDWTAEDAERFLAVGNQELRREAALLAAQAAVADYPRPQKAMMKALETRMVVLHDSPKWKPAAQKLVAAFIDTECEAVSALTTAVDTSAREAEHRKNNEVYTELLKAAAEIMECRPNTLEWVLANAAVNEGVIMTLPDRIAKRHRPVPVEPSIQVPADQRLATTR